MDALIATGDTIETGDNATALISLLPGMVMQMNSKTAVGIDELILTRSGREMSFLMDARGARINLMAGSFCASIAETYVPTELKADTPAGLITATQKASFFLGATTEIVRVTSVDGTLTLRSQRGDESRLNPGYFCDWTPAAESPPSEMPAIGSDAGASQQSQAASTLEGKLPDLMAKMIKTRPITRKSP